MKRLLFILSLIVAVTIGAQARDTYAHDDSVLPEAAKATLSQNFKSKVSLVKIEKELGRIDEYEVILTDGTEVSFDRNGNWKNVETSASKAVPSSLVPAGVSEYVKKNHPGTKIVGLEKERKGYEVELSNGIDMKFDLSGAFLRYDK